MTEKQEFPIFDERRIFLVPLFRVRNGLRVGFQSRPALAKITQGKPSPAALALALAYRLIAAVEAGEARDFSDLARKLKVSQARVSMLVSLRFLSPAVQEAIVLGTPVTTRLTAKKLLRLARMTNWKEQNVVLNVPG